MPKHEAVRPSQETSGYARLTGISDGRGTVLFADNSELKKREGAEEEGYDADVEGKDKDKRRRMGNKSSGLVYKMGSLSINDPTKK